MGLHEGAKEILASPGYRSFTTSWIFNSDWWRIIHRTIYLHFILE